jgi:hypothetical protein
VHGTYLIFAFDTLVGSMHGSGDGEGNGRMEKLSWIRMFQDVISDVELVRDNGIETNFITWNSIPSFAPKNGLYIYVPCQMEQIVRTEEVVLALPFTSSHKQLSLSYFTRYIAFQI